jgi:hypothetical protein
MQEAVLENLFRRDMWSEMDEFVEKHTNTFGTTVSIVYRVLGYYKIMERIERLQQEKYALSLLYEAGPVSEATNVGLRCALKLKYWDVIERKVLDRKEEFWEQVRRETFRAAVQQREWAFVERWADHSLLHEERWWAMEEAYKEKQWSVMLTLADHGLTDMQLTQVTWCRLAMYADWDVVSDV